MLFILILLLSLGASFFLPWWFVAVTAFVPAIFIRSSAGRSFVSGFLAVFVLWVAMAIVLSIPNEHLLAGKVAQMMLMPATFLIFIGTGFIGGLVGGLAALSGNFTRNFIQSKKTNLIV